MVFDTSFFFAECVADVYFAFIDASAEVPLSCPEQEKGSTVKFTLKMMHFVTQMPNGFNWAITSFPWGSGAGAPNNPHKCYWYTVRLVTELVLDLAKGMYGDYETRASAAIALGAFLSGKNMLGPDNVIAHHERYAGKGTLYIARFASFLFFISQAFEVAAHCPNVNSEPKNYGEKDGDPYPLEEFTMVMNWFAGVSYLVACLTNLVPHLRGGLEGFIKSKDPLCKSTCNGPSASHACYINLCDIYRKPAEFGGDAFYCRDMCKEAISTLRKKGIYCPELIHDQPGGVLRPCVKPMLDQMGLDRALREVHAEDEAEADADFARRWINKKIHAADERELRGGSRAEGTTIMTAYRRLMTALGWG
jgi:hypothetical protein